AGVVPLEQVVRQRRQHEVVRVQHVPGQAVRPGRVQVRLEHAADQELGQRRTVEVVEEPPYRPGQVRAEHLGHAQPVQDEGAAVRNLQRLGQQLPVVMDPNAPGSEHAGERVVLLPGPPGPQHVVEQQLADVPRGQPGQLEPGPVHDHLPERPDLGLDAEAHRGLPLPFQASSDHWDSADITEPTLAAEKIESTDATEPTDPIDRIEPAEPIDRMDPLEPMERMDPLEPMDRIDPLEPMLSMEPALPSATLLFRMEPLSQRTAHARHLSAWCKSGLRYTRCWPTGPRSRSARPSPPTSTPSRPCTKRCPRTTATCGSST